MKKSTNAPVNAKRLTENQFKLASTQAWLDLLLQTFKVFVHNRILIGNDIEYEILPYNCVYSKVIYEWLEQLTIVCAPKLWEYNKVFRNYKLTIITKDLSDSYAFACATYYYCPYLKEYLEDFHLDDMYETLFYNAIKLLKAWKTLNISFDINPSDILEPNVVQMMMLLNYLYEFLPQLEVKEVINLTSNLAETSSKRFNIENPEYYPVKYVIKFFDDKYNCFNVDECEIILRGRSNKTLQISYFAKKMEEQQAYMYLCGESPDYHYGKSKVIRIIGTPNLNSFVMEETVTLPIYKAKNFNLEIQSPYEGGGIYKVQGSSLPLIFNNVTESFFLDMKPSYYPKRINLTEYDVNFNEKGVGQFEFESTAFTPFDKVVFFYFRGDIGDFGIKLNTTVQYCVNTETLVVNVAENFTAHHCICSNDNMKEECPKMLIIMVPSRHKSLFENLMQTFVSHLGNVSESFWNKYASK